jgi:hypothetical protein
MTLSLLIWSASSWLAIKTSIMPTTPFIGVRISWLIFAKKVDFAAFASTAALFER